VAFETTIDAVDVADRHLANLVMSRRGRIILKNLRWKLREFSKVLERAKNPS
jgi:hypothetical protein